MYSRIGTARMVATIFASLFVSTLTVASAVGLAYPPTAQIA